MEVHQTSVFRCWDLNCRNIIGIPLDMGPSGFVCPVCGSVYIVDPLTRQKAEDRGIGFSTAEMKGHCIEFFSAERTQTIRYDREKALDFYFPKIGSIYRVFDAAVYDEFGNL